MILNPTVSGCAVLPDEAVFNRECRGQLLRLFSEFGQKANLAEHGLGHVGAADMADQAGRLVMASRFLVPSETLGLPARANNEGYSEYLSRST